MYKKEEQPSVKPTEVTALPNTGQSSIPVAGLGIGTAVLVVLLISKKYRNKVLSVVLIGAMGQSIIMPFHTFAFENKELVQHNTQATVTDSTELTNGVININGYRYVGYFTNGDLGTLTQPQQSIITNTEQPTQPEPKILPKPLKPSQPETPKVEYKTTPEEGTKSVIENKPELRSTTEPVAFKTVEQQDATLTKGQTKVLQEGVNGEQIVFSEVTTIDGKTTSKVIKTSITKQPVNKVIAVGIKEDLATTPIQPEAPKVVDVKPTQPETPKVVDVKPTQPETPKVVDVKPTQPEAPKPAETKPEEKIDKTGLKAQIDRALALIPADYSAASYNALKPILEAALSLAVSLSTSGCLTLSEA